MHCFKNAKRCKSAIAFDLHLQKCRNHFNSSTAYIFRVGLEFLPFLFPCFAYILQSFVDLEAVAILKGSKTNFRQGFPPNTFRRRGGSRTTFKKQKKRPQHYIYPKLSAQDPATRRTWEYETVRRSFRYKVGNCQKIKPFIMAIGMARTMITQRLTFPNGTCAAPREVAETLSRSSLPQAAAHYRNLIANTSKLFHFIPPPGPTQRFQPSWTKDFTEF